MAQENAEGQGQQVQQTAADATQQAQSAPAQSAPAQSNEGSENWRNHPAVKQTFKELAELRKVVAASEAEKKAEEERKAIAAQNFDKVLKDRDARLAEYESKLKSLEHATRRGNAERELMAAGVSSPVMRKGLLADWEEAAPEDTAAWIAEVRKAAPEAFAPVKTPMVPGAVGAVASGTDNSLEARMQSKDPNIRRAAFSEKIARELGSAR